MIKNTNRMQAMNENPVEKTRINNGIRRHISMHKNLMRSLNMNKTDLTKESFFLSSLFFMNFEKRKNKSGSNIGKLINTTKIFSARLKNGCRKDTINDAGNAKKQKKRIKMIIGKYATICTGMRARGLPRKTVKDNSVPFFPVILANDIEYDAIISPKFI
jgi:hypothetical protein